MRGRTVNKEMSVDAIESAINDHSFCEETKQTKGKMIETQKRCFPGEEFT